MAAVRELSEEELKNPPTEINVAGEMIAVPEDAFSLVYSYQVAGETVDVLTLREDVILTIQNNA